MHQPVLLAEVLQGLNPRAGGVYIDGTVGSGGHAKAILHQIGPEGRLLLIDRDEDALKRAQDGLAPWAAQCVFEHADFADMVGVADAHGIHHVDGVLLDLGVSSDQLEAPGRGFSFMRDEPLDMRMNGTQGETAADLVNTLDTGALAGLFADLGEEPMAERIAGRIAVERAAAPIRTTGRLAELVSRAKGGRRGRLHPATLVFQALRMAVNHERDSLDRGLRAGLDMLQTGGRMAVIAFHSGEDRCVKQFMLRHEGRWESLQAGGRAWIGERPAVRRVNRKALQPGAEEVAANPRARSARLRVAERL